MISSGIKGSQTLKLKIMLCLIVGQGSKEAYQDGLSRVLEKPKDLKLFQC